MEVQSFEQRSVSDSTSRGNRVIIVNRQEPSLDWQTTSDVQSRVESTLASPGQSSKRGLCSWLSSCCRCRATNLDAVNSSAKRKRRLSDAVTHPSHIAASPATFDFGPFPSNVWKTSKYTLINFLPKNLFEQFRRIANFYFLITAIIQVVIPFSPIGPSTSLIPLAFVISTTAIKQAYEDFLRHKLDNEVNNRMCQVLREGKKLIKVRAKDIRVGDIVYVQNNEEIPCDMVLLASSGTADRCYITTANLDGETSLKGRTCFQIHQQVGDIEKIHETMLVLECEKPNATLYEFNGFLRAPKDRAAHERLLSDLQQLDEFRKAQKNNYNTTSSSFWHSKRLAVISTIFQRIRQTQLRAKFGKQLTTEQLKNIGAEFLVENSAAHIEIPLDITNLLLRASRLRNTSFVYGLAIYTGPDTRLAYNSQVKPNKFSSLETRVNMFLAIAFFLLLVLTFASALRYKEPKHWYLNGSLERADSFAQILMAHFVLYNYLVPISLYVTLEFVKFFGTLSVTEDKRLYTNVWKSMTARSISEHDHPKQKKESVGPQCNSSDLNEDLGQVEVLFSDKTGTLTENRMLFMACSIGGRLFRAMSGLLYEQPEGLCYMPVMNIARKLFSVSVNRYGALANDLAQVSSPHSIGKTSTAGGNRSSRSMSNKIAKLPPQQRPFDHRSKPSLRDLHLISTLEKQEEVVEFFMCLCLCSTITLNEQTPLEDCLPHKIEHYDYQSASPDEESLISAAAQFGVIVFKSNERECYLAIKRTQKHHKTSGSRYRVGSPVHGHFKCLVETKQSTDMFIVRHFERLITFEFNSIRKKMSVIYKDCDNDCIVMFTKGSENVLDCIGSTLKNPGSGTVQPPHHTPKSLSSTQSSQSQSPQDKILNTTLAHFEAFSKSGLRTMLAAKRLIDHESYEKIKHDLHDVRLLGASENRELRLTQLYRRVESNMTLIGATAVEDSLQDGVPETIENLKEAGIKVWLLTGDKVETAISVAYLCKLLDRNMNLLQLVRQQDTGACVDLLKSFMKRIKMALVYGDEDDVGSPLSPSKTSAQTVSRRPLSQHKLQQHKSKTKKSTLSTPLSSTLAVTEPDDAPRFALIADGRSLHYAMKHAREEFEFVSTNCVCVLGCRLSPLQKAEIVEMIKHGADEPITAAIGDGANDVSMIQEAHVGIGISGKEGRQAVNSSDFAINRFHMVKRLFFVHGHLFYFRTANIIHYFFYKNLLFILPQFLYSFYNLSSATSLYHPIMLICFNMLFTSFPVLIFGLSERNISEDLLENYPRLYRINHKNQLMRYITFANWLLMGTLQAIIAFYFIYFVWGSHTPFIESGKMMGMIGFATILFTALVIGVTLRLYFISKNRTYMFDVASILSCIALPVTLLISSLFDMSNVFNDNTLYRQFFTLILSPTYWLAIFTTTAAMIIPEVVIYVREQIVYHRLLNTLVK